MSLSIAIRALALGAALSTLLPAAAHAGSQDGKVQVKLMMTGVFPKGEVRSAGGAAAPVLDGSDVKTSDNWVPTIAAEYFLTPSVSVETICCTTAHHLTGTGKLAGVPIVEKVLLVPATFTAKYHVDLGVAKPYIGAGPAVFLFLKKRPSGALQALGLTEVDIAPKLGAALQAGVDVPLGADGLSLSADVKRYFMKPQARFRDAKGDVLLETRHKLDPVVASVGLAYRF